MRRRRAVLAALLLAGLSWPAPPPAAARRAAPVVALPFDPLPYDQGATGLGLALRRLGTTGRVLYVTAHPDDEDNGLLVALSRGRGLHVTLFTLTRGAGGLNEIGPELFQELSVVRTGETVAHVRYEAAEQRFGRADDFGYSYSVEECFARWGREEMLGDVVAMVRRVRPDVLLVMPLKNAGGGAAHSASAQLAAEAFAAAADPQRFPDQVAAGLAPWQARTLYEAGVGGPAAAEAAGLAVDTGSVDPLLGMSAVELGSQARARHRTQGMRQIIFPGEGRSGLRPALRAPGVSGVPGDLFDGLDVTVAALGYRFGGSVSEAGAAQQAAERARQLFDPTRPAAALPGLEDGLRALRAAAAAAEHVDEPARGALLDRLAEEERDFGAALALAMGLRVEPTAESPDVRAGGAFTVQTRVRAAWNVAAVEDVSLHAAEGWSVKAVPAPAASAASAGTVTVRHEVRVPDGTRPTQPFWHIEPGVGRNRVDPVADPTLPDPPPPVTAVVRVATAAGPVEMETPVYAARARASGGEDRTALRVVPALSVRVDPPRLAFPLSRAPRRVHVHVTALASPSGSATVRLEAPAGWRVAPAAAEVSWTQPGQEVSARFEVSGPAAPADALLRAVVTGEGGAFSEEWVEIAYPHVHSRPLVRPATLRAAALDLRAPAARRIAYVEGAGDVVAAAIEALGAPVRRLGPDDLARGDLSGLDTIVLGVRAYQARADLRAHHARVMEFARSGGHVVVQLSRAELNQLAPLAWGSVSPAQDGSPFAPYPGRVGTSRVADETAAVRLLLPAHSLLATPHRIGAGDFDGWVQERGSFLFEAADPRYAELLAAGDPWPENPGEKKGLLTAAAVGRGSWTYVGLNLFRQLYVGTPGAWRLLANLVARPRAQGAAR
jgi:LmbE family N-acetylglucosaminyl deacetylase